jgi:hypothetical protein
MTIALAIKVNDGLVLAADSASTLSSLKADGGHDVFNVYDNANKMVNLHKGLPIGALTWGQGEINDHSIGTLLKDLRLRFEGGSPDHLDWKIDPENYQISEIANKVREYFYEELLKNGSLIINNDKYLLGLLIGGYSSSSMDPESYTLTILSTSCVGPTQVLQKSGAVWHGQPEAISRLLLGLSSNITLALQNLGVSPSDSEIYTERLKQQTAITLIVPSMPIQDVIDLAKFLVETTVQFTKFAPGSNSVGGPIEIASMTRHEGFKWISRKLYYPLDLNPREAK